jgi:hypothetical protein
MNSSQRIIIAIAILAVLTGSILAIDSLRRGGCMYKHARTGNKEFAEGCVPVFSGNRLMAGFCRENSARLKMTGFIDKKENKLQEGWLLRDVILLYVDKKKLLPETMVRIESSSRGKKAEIQWKEIADQSNRILLAVSKQGSLKLVSSMKGLETRGRWVQDVDKIEVLSR